MSVALLSGAPAASPAGSGQPRWVITDLGSLGGSYIEAIAINNHSQIVGSTAVRDRMGTHAFLWQDGRMRDLGVSPFLYNSAVAINERGQIVGVSYRYVNAAQEGQETTAESRLWLWEKGRVTRVASFAGRVEVASFNERGQILGSFAHAFLWQNGKMTDIGQLGFNAIRGINDSGLVIGDNYMTGRSFVWQDGKLTYLPTLGTRGSQAIMINNRGQIVGSANRTDHTHAVLWTLRPGS